MGSFRRGSQALTMMSILWALANATRSSLLLASTLAVKKRSGLSKFFRASTQRCSLISASTKTSKNVRDSAIEAILAPTPPAPTTRMRLTSGVPYRQRMRSIREPSGYLHMCITSPPAYRYANTAKRCIKKVAQSLCFTRKAIRDVTELVFGKHIQKF